MTNLERIQKASKKELIEIMKYEFIACPYDLCCDKPSNITSCEECWCDWLGKEVKI